MREFDFNIPKFDETYNTNNVVEDDIIYKLIDRHILDTYKGNWEIIVTDTSKELRDYYNEHLRGKPQENSIRCFETKKQLVTNILPIFDGITYKDLSKNNSVFYFFMLFQSL